MLSYTIRLQGVGVIVVVGVVIVGVGVSVYHTLIIITSKAIGFDHSNDIGVNVDNCFRCFAAACLRQWWGGHYIM